MTTEHNDLVLTIVYVNRNVSVLPYIFLYFKTTNGHTVCVGPLWFRAGTLLKSTVKISEGLADKKSHLFSAPITFH